ncbi:MAG: bacterioferritin [Alphaproteobacteria bacterium]
MKGKQEVIDVLNEALKLELGAINQYWLHFRLLSDWGFEKLAQKEREESVEEMGHADTIVDRIIFLGGHPNLQTIAPLMIGQDIKEVLECDLKGEKTAIEHYSKSFEVCRSHGDYVSMELFKTLLRDEEGHEGFLETQLALLEKIGVQNYGMLQAEPSNAGPAEAGSADAGA